MTQKGECWIRCRRGICICIGICWLGLWYLLSRREKRSKLCDESCVSRGFGLQEAVKALGFLEFAALEGDGF